MNTSDIGACFMSIPPYNTIWVSFHVEVPCECRGLGVLTHVLAVAVVVVVVVVEMGDDICILLHLAET